MSTALAPLNWAVLGTAGIARSRLLPALLEAGGHPAVVAGRDLTRTRAYAEANGVERAVHGYQAALDDPDVDAVYVALPNTLHAQWTIAALEAGKAVLCEKPLCSSAADVRSVLDVAQRAPGPLWEAFVFPWHQQFARLDELISDGAIGELREIESSFHFPLRATTNIRLSVELGGGALADVGCYPMRLAQLLFRAAPAHAGISAVRGVEVEVEAAAILDYPHERRLHLTCGFRRANDTGTRLLGTDGVIELTNPYHPTASDSLCLRRPGHDPVIEYPTTDQQSFSGAIRHITAAVRGAEPPRHLALDDSQATADALELAQAAL